MSIKQRKQSKNPTVQDGETAIMEDTAVTMEDSTALMGGPTAPDTAKPNVKIKQAKVK